MPNLNNLNNLNLLPVPAFSDNYIWMLHNAHDAVVIDPGDASPVLEVLERLQLQLRGILVTHNHADHVGGVSALHQATGAQVYGPSGPVREGDRINILGVLFSVMEVPGHTADHLAYYGVPLGQAPLLFCGDTLFSGGCGRLLGGTAAQMHTSLDRLAALPGNTRVCCAHEYTVSNLKFACTVEPDNDALHPYQKGCEELQAKQKPTLPSYIDRERQINPFLRTRIPAVAAAAQAHAPSPINPHDPVAVLAALREWKNNFK